MEWPKAKALKSAYLITAVAAAAFLVFLPFKKTDGGPDDGPLIQQLSPDGFSVVWWSGSDAKGDIRVRGSGVVDAIFSAVRSGNRYEARATGLEPGTTYRYEIVHTEKHGNSLHLYTGQASTAPSPGVGSSFIVFADSGSGKRTQYRLARVMNRYPTDLILHAGDLVYPEGEARDYHKKFFRPYRALISHVPFYPVLGNHDIRTDNGRPFLDTFSLPANGPPSVEAERCYWFDYGDARFVGLDSNLDGEVLSTAVAPLLREILETSSNMWRFVFFHHPPWAGGSREPDAKIRDALVPAIEAGGADVVFCAHNHLYERTHPMLAGRIAPSSGVVYVTSAAGGKSLHEEENTEAPYLAAFNDTKYSFTWVHVAGPRLELMQISEDDEILDRVVLKKTRVVAGAKSRQSRCIGDRVSW